MPKPKVLHGQEVVRIFESFGFFVVDQRGSHIKLRRGAKDNTRETLTIPNHKEIDIGTAREIFNQALDFVSQVELQEHFYT